MRGRKIDQSFFLLSMLEYTQSIQSAELREKGEGVKAPMLFPLSSANNLAWLTGDSNDDFALECESRSKTTPLSKMAVALFHFLH